ncbi:ribosomal protein S18-alanine N-acetyltransferase [Sulfurimonas sp.]|jgi:ribosomal-protein-alanine N-acetyltransferase|uniref:ribosomal protein S18-alanine N-acetyltransferase n=1 Tax=Sulfurimonas sp. TaxID=2022749 RepID=UPI0025E6CB78|nr:ribosomal protein S18-alanine N-acetyltransferase [Sulfurimonas sp.]MCK9472347.1 ribosomal protein S18-alanine N-acetyltransferase [Sulfurimonas sp.]MDD3506122.1 ribosomal protein S18-alanine N-acetyltransferase [Sulfurimonas sp.]
MKIKKAQKSDVSSLYALEGELFCKENYPLSRGSFAYHVNNNLLYVAEVEEKIVGYILVLIKRKNAKLYSIGVAKAYRNRKISQELLEFILKELLSLGFKTLLLEVRTDNEAAIALYKKMGFSELKKLKAFYGDGCDACLMELRYAKGIL